jgi:MFS-type transporter involved in bile tolerance (Atg22 family)
MIHNMLALGWIVCLIGLLGALDEVLPILRIVPQMEDPAFMPLVDSIARATALLLFGLVVGIACLAVSSFSRSRLSFLYQDLSNRILAASTKKGT